MDEWMLNKLSASALIDMGFDEFSAWQIVRLNGLLLFHQDWFSMHNELPPGGQAMTALQGWLADPEVQRMINVNRHKGVLWFNKEAFEQILAWLFTVALIQISAQDKNKADKDEEFTQLSSLFDIITKAEEHSAYQVERLIDSVQIER